jgi:prepilin-type N-terminal cleavage/methylation domain-containing protein
VLGAVMGRHRGLTLVELMVVITVAGVLVLIAAPSFRDFIEMQRLRGVNAELLSDIQYTRSEATRRNEPVGMLFGTTGTGSARIDCYTIFRRSGAACNCNRPVGAVCANELRTVKIPSSRGVQLSRGTGLPVSFSFDPISGGVVPVQLENGTIVNSYQIDVNGVRRGQLRNTINPAGRPTVCTPDGSVSGAPACS